MGWVRCDDPDEWERTVVALRAAGVELPRGLAKLDLRWWCDRILAPGSRVRMPSRPQLAERWGWTDKRVRLLLADESGWVDPYVRDAWAAHREAEGPTRGRPRADEGPAEGRRARGATPTPAESGPTKGRPRADEGPAEGHRRVDPPSPSPSRSPIPQPPASPAGGIEVDEDQVVALARTIAGRYDEDRERVVDGWDAPDIAQVASGATEPRHGAWALAELRRQRDLGVYVGSVRKRSLVGSVVEAARRVLADQRALDELLREARAGPAPPTGNDVLTEPLTA